MKKIMVLEDRPELVRLYEQLISNYSKNTEMVSFENGKEGLDYLVKNKDITAIITDNDMLYMTGTQFVEEIRKQGYNMPILIHSGKLLDDNDYVDLNVRVEMKGSLAYLKDFVNGLD